MNIWTFLWIYLAIYWLVVILATRERPYRGPRKDYPPAVKRTWWGMEK